MSAELKPGQRYPTPTRGFGDRVFYETLLKQNPSSAMAQEWCVNNGVLSHEEALKLYKVIMKRKGKPMPKSASGSSSSPKRRKKIKREIEGEAVDVGMSACGDEGIGMTAM